MIVYSPTRRRMKSHRTNPGKILRLVAVGLVSSSMVGPGWPNSSGATVYRCLDRTGKTVLSNRQSELHDCHVLIEETGPRSKSPAGNTTRQGSTPPLNSEIPTAPSRFEATPPYQPPDEQNSPIGVLPAPNHDTPATPPQVQPCSYGLNPLNPLSNVPCAQSDRSGEGPSEAAPIPAE